MNRAWSDQTRGYALGAPATLYVGFLIAVPLVLTVMHSFWSQNYLEYDKTFTLANYSKAAFDPLYQSLFLRSFAISALVTLLTVVTAYPIAYFIAFRAKRKMLWLFLVTIPFWTSYLLRVFSWKLILGYNGMLNSALLWTGLIAEPLDFLLYNPSAVVITLAHAWAPFAILPIYVSLQKIDRSLLEVASDLGESRLGRFMRVTLPLSMLGAMRIPMPRLTRMSMRN